MLESCVAVFVFLLAAKLAAMLRGCQIFVTLVDRHIKSCALGSETNGAAAVVHIHQVNITRKSHGVDGVVKGDRLMKTHC